MANRKSLFTSIATIGCIFTGIIFAVCTYFKTGSFSWFTSTKQVEGNGLAVKSAYEDVNADYRLYRRDLTTFKGTDGITNEDDEFEYFTLSKFSFLSYDTIFTSRNGNTPALLRLFVSGKDVNKDSGTISVTLNRDETKTAGTSHLDEYFSSVINFSCGTDSSIYRASYNADRIYTNGISSFEEDTITYETKSFCTKLTEKDGSTPATWSKSNSITFDVNYTSDDWNKDENGVDILNIYIYMFYDAELVESYFNGVSGTSGHEITSLEGNEVAFENDLKMLSVNYKK